MKIIKQEYHKAILCFRTLIQINYLAQSPQEQHGSLELLYHDFVQHFHFHGDHEQCCHEHDVRPIL